MREEAIFAVCKRCANEGFACMCKEKIYLYTRNVRHDVLRSLLRSRNAKLLKQVNSISIYRYIDILFACTANSMSIYTCIDILFAFTGA